MANGNTTTNPNLAATLQIQPNGQLTANSLYYSADPTTPYEIFEPSPGDSVLPITQTFYSQGGVLTWTSQYFDGGAAGPSNARFWRFPKDGFENAQIRAYFHGVDPSVDDADLLNGVVQLVGTPSYSAASTHAPTYFATSGVASRSSASPRASPSTRVSEDGGCGPSPFGYSQTCAGSTFGSCCNFQTNQCSNSVDACGRYCYPQYGICPGYSYSSSASYSPPSISPLSQSSYIATVSSEWWSSVTDQMSPPGSASSSLPATSVSSSLYVTPVPTTQSKRGLVYVPNSLFPEDDLVWNQVGSPIGWYYNYQPAPSGPYNTTLEFIPMLFGDYENTFTQTVISLKQAGMNITNVLAFNEPDGPYNEGGSQVDPVAGAARWMQDIEPLREYGIRLGAPAVTGSLRGLQWLQDFYTACNGNCHADFQPVHFYGPYSGVQWMVTTTRGNYPNMTVWLTEFNDPQSSLMDTNANDEETILWLDGLDYLERYSIFGGFRSYRSNIGYNASMLDQCGNLTPLGDFYMNQPPGGNIPTDTPCSTGTIDVICPGANNTEYTDTNTGKIFSISCDTDRFGGDLNGGGFTTGSFTECINACSRANNGCVDVSWNGDCYWKGLLAAGPSQAYGVSNAIQVGQTTPTTPQSSSVSPVPSSSTRTSSAMSSPTAYTPPSCATNLAIPSPSAVPGMACVTAQTNNTSGGPITLPFELSIFGSTSSTIYAEDSGILSLNTGATAYSNNNLPDPQFNTTLDVPQPNLVILPFFVDQTILSNGRDGIFYYANTTYLGIQWRTSTRFSPTEQYEYFLEYFTDSPGVYQFHYFGLGASYPSRATIGVQAGAMGPSAQYDNGFVGGIGVGNWITCDASGTPGLCYRHNLCVRDASGAGC
ncbi:hypothetical protein BT63DRAFT_460635 [Microthyrium microscopicum]|uniref:Uncharacterized protein n=1 Tax=Microthyrium microscopicum TaxID=703497 RepID=A0A6A6TZA6_9PEZI|nr:hypothetical protein BT63DRAFT_460635 [Microthyrium microscopicum]